ncbi:TOMM precursor leader peptide-binding protein [Nocardia carnea]|uniref:TOMM precursor leader peptide-binding protein n=1 Tax=Nocardia carnea TaxID=37328 RepID=UPI002454CF10|nr:TOMM precursor leader peptide-binding protein [Nocardia carnea]
MTTLRPRGPLLHPRVPILVRSTGQVQLGWDPETAVLCEAPGLDTQQVLGFLRLLDGLNSRPAIVWRARSLGLEPRHATALFEVIDAAGLVVHPSCPAGCVRSIRVHGTGPLAEAISSGLCALGIRPSRSRDRSTRLPGPVAPADLVVLADALIPDPCLVRELGRARIAHLVVRLRDGKGLVGPLVLPGLTSCLRCADLARADRDAEWPRLAAQLLGRMGHASPAGIAAVAALALGELETILACDPASPPDTLNRTLEFDLGTRELSRRPWTPHERCGCLMPQPSSAVM